jgi:Bifunctional DNA primase/polymerase, N-terminal
VRHEGWRQRAKSILTQAPQRISAAARRYVGAGRSVFPIGTNKRPAVDESKPYQQRHATAEELSGWYGNGRRLGIAIVCGAISGGSYGVLVIDIEGRAAYLFPY